MKAKIPQKNRNRGRTRNRWVILPVVLGLILTLSLAIIAPLAGAAFPGSNGKIAFMSSRDGNYEIYSMNADGTSQTRLTNNSAEDDNPMFSPDGTRIAFGSWRDGTGDIYVMDTSGDANGSIPPTRLTFDNADWQPVWSPDGSQIAYQSGVDGDAEIYLMNANGSGQQRLTSAAGEDSYPAWSSDGSKIAFSSYRDGDWEIYLMNADGSSQSNLTNSSGSKDYAPSWSPDGSKIAFTSDRAGSQNLDIWVMNGDGTNPVNITNHAGSDYNPSWSPDGSKIAFGSDRDGNNEVYVVNADGSGSQSNLSNNGSQDWFPDWQPQPNHFIMRVSTDSASLQGNNHSFWASTSADGHYVAFQSGATNLVPPGSDTNGVTDVFVKDTQTGATTRVSTDTGGVQRSKGGRVPSISADGRYVAFESDAMDPTGGLVVAAIYIKDTQTDVTALVSADSGGILGNSDSYWPSISADGRYVSFCSSASNLVPAGSDTNGVYDVFVKDTQTGAIKLVSTDSGGGQGNSHSTYPSISADGRFVAFQSDATNLVPGDTNFKIDAFVKDTLTGAITRVSTDSGGNEGNEWGWNPSISADGRYVAFHSDATNLVPPGSDTNGVTDVFVKDTQTGATTRVSTDTGGVQGNSQSTYPTISADGRYVAFESDATNLVPGDTNGVADIFVKDTQTGAIKRVSVNSFSAQGNISSRLAAISADAQYVAFESGASNLVPGDTNRMWDVFLAGTDAACAAGQPPLSLSGFNPYWGSFADYEARLLSVNYVIANAAMGPSAYAAQITGSTATNSVTLATGMPVSLGNIMAGLSHGVTLQYTVPASTVAFKTSLFATAQDSCGVSYTYP